MTRADLTAALAKGHTHAISRNRVTLNKPTVHNILSTHASYESARKALMSGKSKGNAIYAIERLIGEQGDGT
jgi:hypothetical protein